MGCKPVPVTFDSRSASYALAAEGGCFTPTFPTEAALLSWAGQNVARIERHVRRGEPLEPDAFLAHVIAAAHAEAGDDAQAMADAIAPRLTEMMRESRAMRERDVDCLIEDLADGRGSVPDILDALSGHLNHQFVKSPTP